MAVMEGSITFHHLLLPPAVLEVSTSDPTHPSRNPADSSCPPCRHAASHCRQASLSVFTVEIGREVHGQVIRMGFDSDVHVVTGYAKVGNVDSARMVFEQMPERNVISWTAVIAGYAQMNRPNEAIEIFRRMQLENVEPDEIAIPSFDISKVPSF